MPNFLSSRSTPFSFSSVCASSACLQASSLFQCCQRCWNACKRIKSWHRDLTWKLLRTPSPVYSSHSSQSERQLVQYLPRCFHKNTVSKLHRRFTVLSSWSSWLATFYHVVMSKCFRRSQKRMQQNLQVKLRKAMVWLCNHQLQKSQSKTRLYDQKYSISQKGLIFQGICQYSKPFKNLMIQLYLTFLRSIPFFQ